VKRLAAAKKDAELFVVEGMHHGLKKASSDTEQKKADNDPSMPLAPKLVNRIVTFLSKALIKG
jgi:hypothetical protein